VAIAVVLSDYCSGGGMNRLKDFDEPRGTSKATVRRFD
jgi:hypothetical protein